MVQYGFLKFTAHSRVKRDLIFCDLCGLVYYCSKECFEKDKKYHHNNEIREVELDHCLVFTICIQIEFVWFLCPAICWGCSPQFLPVQLVQQGGVRYQRSENEEYAGQNPH